MGIKQDQLSSKLGLGGVTPEKRKGAEAVNDIHFSGGAHVHTSDVGPVTPLGTAATDLVASKYNSKAPYANPEV